MGGGVQKCVELRSKTLEVDKCCADAAMDNTNRKTSYFYTISSRKVAFHDGVSDDGAVPLCGESFLGIDDRHPVAYVRFNEICLEKFLKMRSTCGAKTWVESRCNGDWRSDHLSAC